MSDQGDMWRLAGQVGNIALEMVIAVGLGLWAGQWADTHFGWTPWGLFAGIGLGIGAAILLASRAARMIK